MDFRTKPRAYCSVAYKRMTTHWRQKPVTCNFCAELQTCGSTHRPAVSFAQPAKALVAAEVTFRSVLFIIAPEVAGRGSAWLPSELKIRFDVKENALFQVAIHLVSEPILFDDDTGVVI